MRPVVDSWMRSSPIAAAALSPSSRSPGEDPGALGGASPHPGEAVGLELEPDRELVREGRVLPTQPLDLSVRAEQRLNVVADLVRDHVCLGEVTWRTELLLELLEERRVEVHPLVGGTVEGSGGPGRRPAAALRPASEQDDRRVLVVQTGTLEHVVPHELDVLEHRLHEVRRLVGRIDLALAPRAGGHPRVVERGQRVAEPAETAVETARDEDDQQDDQDQAADSKAASADREPADPRPHPHPAGWARPAAVDEAAAALPSSELPQLHASP